MSFSADKLKSIAFSPAYRGFALGNKYDVIITPRNPASLTSTITDNLKDLRFFKPCYKRYLSKQIDSRLVQVPASEWDYTLFLPSHQFKKASANKVWADSRKSI